MSSRMEPRSSSARTAPALVAAAVVAPAVAALAVLGWTTSAYADLSSGLTGSLESALATGNWAVVLGICFVAGLATSLTPCVYPMISITVSVFGARQTKSRMEGAMLSSMFVLGLAALFTPLGLGAALTGSAFGALLANPYVLVGLALLFVALSLSMFGLYEMNLPPALQNRLATVGGSGMRGAFALGFVSAIIAAPCTGPVLGALLTWISRSRDVVLGGSGLLLYSLGLGLLFWVVGTFAVSLPKSGRWLEGVKSVFGCVMIAVAIYYVRDLIPGLVDVAERTLPFLGISVALVVVGVALGAIHLSYSDSTWGTRARKTLGIAALVAGLLGCVGYLEALPPGARILWGEDFAKAKADANARGVPLLVDFGASWCGACKEIDHEAFSDPRVVAEARRFVTVRIDLSPGKASPDRWAALRSYERTGLPLVVLHDAEGQERHRVLEPIAADAFLAMMRSVR